MAKLTDEERAARVADGKVALAEYFSDQKSLHSRTANLRTLRLADEAAKVAKARSVSKLTAAINAGKPKAAKLEMKPKTTAKAKRPPR